MSFGLSEEVTSGLRSVFRQFPDIREVRIFGSRAKGSYAAGSDIDLALIADGIIPFDEIMDITIRIDDLKLLYKVDLVDYNKYKNTPIGEHIDRVGKPFYER